MRKDAALVKSSAGKREDGVRLDAANEGLVVLLEAFRALEGEMKREIRAGSLQDVGGKAVPEEGGCPVRRNKCEDDEKCEQTGGAQDESQQHEDDRHERCANPERKKQMCLKK